MDHIAVASLFTLLFLGAGAGIQAMVRQYGPEIVAALRGEPLVRPTIYRARIRPAARVPRPASPLRPAAS